MSENTKTPQSDPLLLELDDTLDLEEDSFTQIDPLVGMSEGARAIQVALFESFNKPPVTEPEPTRMPQATIVLEESPVTLPEVAVSIAPRPPKTILDAVLIPDCPLSTLRDTKSCMVVEDLYMHQYKFQSEGTLSYTRKKIASTEEEVTTILFTDTEEVLFMTKQELISFKMFQYMPDIYKAFVPSNVEEILDLIANEKEAEHSEPVKIKTELPDLDTPCSSRQFVDLTEPKEKYVEMTCVVCFDKLIEQKISVASCGHLYCRHCAYHMRLTSPKCAVCRKRVKFSKLFV